ncbi:MAG TPA: hypothetical protein VK619_06845 [Pyrinomonadaceae bacterium]|nr:hypothetical protein [Pyrinomonadaceae bacterium]
MPVMKKVLLIILLCLALGAARAQSQAKLSQTDRIRMAEAFRLGDRVGDRVWKNWKKTPFAVLLVTPDYEFLIRHPKPSNDFTSIGYDSLLRSEVYFRKRVFQTGLLATFPAVSGVSTIVIGQAENTDAKTSTPWIVTLFHEHFHQMQDSQPDFYAAANALNLSRGDQTGMWMLNFPFPYDRPEVVEQFSILSRALDDALSTTDTNQFGAKLAAYMSARKRFQEILSPDDYRYYSFQLWKEGTARYTEYRVALWAAQHYRPTREFRSLTDFKPFADEARAILERIHTQLSNPRLMDRRRASFYAMGGAEALLLDRANPRWHERYFVEKFQLERLFP